MLTYEYWWTPDYLAVCADEKTRIQLYGIVKSENVVFYQCKASAILVKPQIFSPLNFVFVPSDTYCRMTNIISNEIAISRNVGASREEVSSAHRKVTSILGLDKTY